MHTGKGNKQHWGWRLKLDKVMNFFPPSSLRCWVVCLSTSRGFMSLHCFGSKES